MCDPVTATVVGLSAVGGAYASKKMAPKPPEIVDAPDVQELAPQAPADISDPAAQQASQRERRRRAGAAGRRSTILTSPAGASVSSQTAPVKTLLGS